MYFIAQTVAYENECVIVLLDVILFPIIVSRGAWIIPISLVLTIDKYPSNSPIKQVKDSS